MRLFLFFLVIALIAIGPASAQLSDEEREEKTQELQQLKKQINKMRDELNLVRSKHDKARAELQETESRIGNLVQKLRSLSRKLNNQQRRLSRLKQDRKKYRHAVSQQRHLLEKQIHAAYVIGRQEYMKLLLNQEDPAKMGRAVTYYSYFNKARSQRINQAFESLEKLDSVEKEIQRQTIKFKDLQKQRRRDKAALENTIRARQLAVANLKTQLLSKSEQLNQLVADEQRLEKVLNVIQKMLADIPVEAGKKQLFSRLRGKLAWPVVGKVRKLFGRKRAGGQVSWNGVMIRAREGNNVRAVAGGRVAYADWLRGYGLLIIVDHGRGYMSLYGHNQSLYKETGDWVEAKEVIAAVGKSGGQRTSGLYFEIRYNGKPSNPVKWCRKTGRT